MLRSPLAAVIVFVLAAGAGAEEITVMAVPIATFKDAAIGEAVDGTVWRGGMELKSDATSFGGLSGLAFTDREQRLAMVSDKGWFISGQLIYDEAGVMRELVGVTVEAIRNSQGNALPRAYARDAEAITPITRDGEIAAVRVGFENLTRVADFDIVDGRPGGAAREVDIPDWLSHLRTNDSLEAVCIASDASPVAGSTMLITEGDETAEGNLAAYMRGSRDRGEFSIVRTPGLNPTDCAFLPNGDMLLLERGTGIFGFVMQVRRIAANEVRPGAAISGDVVLTASGGAIDNMEGITVHAAPNGETRFVIVSDNNYNEWERTLLLEFGLPE
ncbi:MAG: esterase-like activity of phytase family protein [Alphaproteobacteria bacterium]|nr:esterase-like activity of phytase family protein [Alphaproteobacteria bacterium]